MKNLVFDIGGTSIKYGVCLNNRLTDMQELSTHAEKGGTHILETIISLIRTHADYDAIGISTAGQVHAEEGYIIYANQNIPGYTGIQYKKTLEELFHVPVAVENDVNAAALGEAVYGAGQDHEQFLMLTYGTGVGGAVIHDRKVFHGSSYSASEFGAIITHSDARLSGNDFFDGCYEKYASTTGLVQMTKGYRKELDTGRKIFQNLQDDNVLKLLDKWVDEIMLGLATLTHIYNPSCIILGGGIMAQPLILKKIEEKKSRFIMPSFAHVHITAAALGNSAGVLGANYLAAQLLQP
ncbi:MAG: ROK family protein [Lachnospiraceae bacterium]|nr:ROK family protein [Lachnospiraceae bacterium]MDE6184712.1 ROK family protein [Lachnospiraceae bacterium]